jgi:DNA-binding NarL/FixJ family response regulator
MPTSVAIVDDRQLFREGLKLLIATQFDLQVAGEASDAASAYALVDESDPSVVIVAKELTGIGGIAVTRELVRRRARSRVLLVASSGGDEDARQALSAGARGFVFKAQPSNEAFDAIRTVARGNTYLAPSLPPTLLDWRDDTRASDGWERPLDCLSARERQVFELLVRGHTNGTIARALGISAKTVDTHRTKVLRKIGVHSIVELVRFAARNQLPLD